MCKRQAGFLAGPQALGPVRLGSLSLLGPGPSWGSQVVPGVPGVITLGDGMISCHLFSPVVS